MFFFLLIIRKRREVCAKEDKSCCSMLPASIFSIPSVYSKVIPDTRSNKFSNKLFSALVIVNNSEPEF